MENKIILNDGDLGYFLYIGMGIIKNNNHKVVLSIGYTPEYANKKALEFIQSTNDTILYEDISIIKIGDKEKCGTIKPYIYKNYLEHYLKVGTKIKIGENYSNEFGFNKDEIIQLEECFFEYDNGLYTNDEACPGILDKDLNDADSIYHLFGNDFENWLDNEIIFE